MECPICDDISVDTCRDITKLDMRITQVLRARYNRLAKLLKGQIKFRKSSDRLQRQAFINMIQC